MEHDLNDPNPPLVLPVRPRGIGFYVESRELYVWEADAREVAQTAAELLQPAHAPGEPSGAR